MAETQRIRYVTPIPYKGDWARPLASRSSPRTWRIDPGGYAATIKFPTPAEAKPHISLDEAVFLRHVATWRKDTAMQSSLLKKVTHQSYQRIIGMGRDAIPMILREMKRRPGHWFWALDAITQGVNPAEHCETLSEATVAWIAWGEAEGIL